MAEIKQEEQVSTPDVNGAAKDLSLTTDEVLNVDAGRYRNVSVARRPNWFRLLFALTLTATTFLIGTILCCLIIYLA